MEVPAMKALSSFLSTVAVSLLLLTPLGCGDDDGNGGGTAASPTPTSTMRPPASPTAIPQPTSTATRSPAPSHTPAATPTATVGGLDISICAPDAGPFSAIIDNPFFPLPVGAQWVFTGESEGAPVRVVITSLADTEVVAGVTARVVEEREWNDGELVEVSRNFFVETLDGTVCYYGEDVDDYEAGEIVSHDGAWRAGVNGALPGILMPANPRVGQTFEQEVAVGVAQDHAELIAAGESVTVGLGTFTDTIRFRESSPLDSGTSEKVYARGVGLILDAPVARIPASLSFCGTLDGEGCAPDSERVDLAQPSFSNPTAVTNPLFPVSRQHSVVLLGAVDGEPFRAEVTLLPTTKTILLNGTPVETLESQYVAFIGGRLHEVALDWYGQDDGGAVWYFGEDVFNYDRGGLADTGGTWLAGRDGPVAMIMPADPHVGDVYRPENIPGLVFEEVTVKSIGLTVDGPYGPVVGAITVEEVHLNGTVEDKTFAPGYGEFFTGGGGDVEALALAVPTDALATPLPAELATLTRGADEIFDAAEAEDWDSASAALTGMSAAWATYRAAGGSPRLEAQMIDALEALSEQVSAEDSLATRQTALDVARATLDFHLRHRPPAEIDRARFELWARQILIDAANEDPDRARGDVLTLAWVLDRFAHTLSHAELATIETLLGDLRSAVDDGDLLAASSAAEVLLDALEP
jgi:hypothetical protein